ncbi:sugar transferase [Sphingomonas sp. BIUV-7]|uniref:Sugar transferase n=1 Tax=Sphingomonas natans TaxID=3063330 RepID=A0ABT8YF04_9SPHN|nr:sugar transferase [Sphingomonas sp. BIUV-7]MDO6416160.1 sugar transferase [Sphingomonas sp. BIUV-7]
MPGAMHLVQKARRPALRLGLPDGWPTDVSRLMDIGVAFAALLVVAPLMVVIAVAIFLTDPGPVFIAHRRLGRGGRDFARLKFRTRVLYGAPDRPDYFQLGSASRWIRDDEQCGRPVMPLIPFGELLARTSFDDLPQLFNVLRGHMSLVGPQPIVGADIAFYGHYLSHYTSLRPGITGLWQTSGRRSRSRRRRVALDVLYSRRRSLGLDVKILAQAVARSAPDKDR